MPRDRVTRRAYTGVPVYTTNYRQPADWRFWRFWDVTPLIAAIVWIGSTTAAVTTLQTWVLVATIFWAAFRLSRRLGRRGRECEARGHVPYRPIREVNEWKCWHCSQWLDMDDDELIFGAMRDAVDDVEAARGKVPQSRYSDRR